MHIKTVNKTRYDDPRKPMKLTSFTKKTVGANLPKRQSTIIKRRWFLPEFSITIGSFSLRPPWPHLTFAISLEVFHQPFSWPPILPSTYPFGLSITLALVFYFTSPLFAMGWMVIVRMCHGVVSFVIVCDTWNLCWRILRIFCVNSCICCLSVAIIFIFIFIFNFLLQKNNLRVLIIALD